MSVLPLESPLEYRLAQQQLINAAVRDIRAVWATLDPADGIAVRTTLEAILPDIVEVYGEAVATLAAQRFEAMRAAAGVPGMHTARTARPPSRERVNASTRAVIGSLFQAEPDGATALKEVEAVTDRFIKQAGRDTIQQNAIRDRRAYGFRRVLAGDGNCGFCVMIASRDTVYTSRDAAGGTYHTRCDCVPDPVYDLDAFLDDPDRRALEERYNSARELAGPDPDDISYVLRARAEGKSDEEIRDYLRNPRPRSKKKRR